MYVNVSSFSVVELSGWRHEHTSQGAAGGRKQCAICVSWSFWPPATYDTKSLLITVRYVHVPHLALLITIGATPADTSTSWLVGGPLTQMNCLHLILLHVVVDIIWNVTTLSVFTYFLLLDTS